MIVTQDGSIIVMCSPPFSNNNASKAAGVENQGQIAHFLTPSPAKI